MRSGDGESRKRGRLVRSRDGAPEAGADSWERVRPARGRDVREQEPPGAYARATHLPARPALTVGRKGKGGGAWHRERESDTFFHEARRRGLRSRAALKLEAIDARDHLFRGARVVVDLGAAPGGWSQVARHALAPGGRVFALDVAEMAPLAGVEFIRGDFLHAETAARLEASVGPWAADLVMSDMAPNLTGMKASDQARWRELADSAAVFAGAVLKPGGAFLVKLFQGEETELYLRALRERFTGVVVRKPAASRKHSAETYALARGLKPGGKDAPRATREGAGNRHVTDLEARAHGV